MIYRSSKDNDWDNALKESSDIVAAAGGDGLVGKVAKRLVGRRTPIALLPMGTANNVAKTLGLMDKPLEELITGWTSARRKTFDVGVASGPWGSKCMIEGLGLGLFTETMDCLHATDEIDLAHARDADEEIRSVLEILRDRLPSCPVKTLQAQARRSRSVGRVRPAGSDEHQMCGAEPLPCPGRGSRRRPPRRCCRIERGGG